MLNVINVCQIYASYFLLSPLSRLYFVLWTHESPTSFWFNVSHLFYIFIIRHLLNDVCKYLRYNSIKWLMYLFTMRYLRGLPIPFAIILLTPLSLLISPDVSIASIINWRSYSAMNLTSFVKIIPFFYRT